MLCPKCGTQLSDDMMFCPECGCPVSSQQFQAPIPASQYVETPVQQPAWEQPQQPAWEETQPFQQPAWEETQQFPASQQPAWEETQQPAWEQPQQPQQPAWEETQTQTAPVEKAPKKKFKPKKASAGILILCIFLCILVFLSGFYAAILGTLRLTLTEDNIEKVMDEYDAAELTLPGKDGEPVALSSYIEAVGGVNFKKDYGFSKNDLEKLLNKSFVRDFLSHTLSSYANSLLRDKKAAFISRDILLDFFEDNDKEIFETVNYSFLGRDVTSGGEKYYDKSKKINTEEVDAVVEALGLEADEEVTWKWIEKQAGVDTSLISTLLSIYVLIGAIALAVILIAVIFLVNRKTLHSAFTLTGITCMILGGLLTLIGGAGLVYASITKYSVFKMSLSPFAVRFLIIGIAILVIGVLLLFVFKKIYDSIAAKRQPAEIAPEPQLP